MMLSSSCPSLNAVPVTVLLKRLPLYFGVHFHQFRPIMCSALTSSNLRYIRRLVATKGCYLPGRQDGGAINDYSSFASSVLGTDHEVLWECKASHKVGSPYSCF
jgi:hypothetical protein